MSWFASWLPSIPTINLSIPASIQGRFVSFFLKKFLGHFFKPGQLDTPQIDSQIGSGYVQVNDLELNPTTINQYLDGLPLEFEEGIVKAVTARIPWPNPLTSNIGFSVNSLHLTLRLQEPVHHNIKPEADLTTSVVSVAESFVQEELADPQEAQLWESFHAQVHPQDSEDHIVPGGLESFIQPNEDGWGDFHEVDPVGVSMFATLIERLLARFQFNAQVIHITLIDPDNITLKFSLSDIRYSTTEVSGQNQDSGTRRTLSLHGIRLSIIGRVPFPTTSTQSPSTTRPSTPSTVNDRRFTSNTSPLSSSSSLDEDTEFQMSQSLAVLPPRPLYESTSSSIYHSIIAEEGDEGSNSQVPPTSMTPGLPTSPVGGHPPQRHELAKEHTLLSFGSIPFEASLTTPAPDQAVGGPSRTGNDKYLVDISCGSIAVALQPWQIAGLVPFIETLTAIESAPSKPGKSSTAPPFNFDGELHIRSMSALFLPSQPVYLPLGEPIEHYFLHPLTPPQVTFGNTRLAVDGITVRASSLPNGISSSATVVDLSAFFFPDCEARNRKGDVRLPNAIPILIADPNLPSLYDSTHTYPSRADPFQASVAQPTVPVLDWFNKSCMNFGAKVSQWRTRKHPSERHRRANKTASDEQQDDDSKQRQFLCLTHNSVSSKRKAKIVQSLPRVEIEVAPLHILVDLELAMAQGGMLWFMEQVTSETKKQARRSSPHHGYLSDEDGPFSPEASPPPSPLGPKGDDRKAPPPTSTLSWTVNIPVLRVSTRAPPPPGHARRSGILTLDVHKIFITNQSPSQHRRLRFSMASSRDLAQASPEDQPPLQVLALVRCQRIVVGCSTVAEDHSVAFLSLGSLQASSELAEPLSPHVAVSRRDVADGNNALSASIDIPSVYVSLSKKQLDALHYWIDDVSQTLERSNAASAEPHSGQDSKDPSLIGSRFFAKSRTGSGYNSQGSTEGVTTYLYLGVTEVYVRVQLPRSDPEGPSIRPFDVACSDFNANVKLHGAGKIEAIVNIMDAFIQDTDTSEELRAFLTLTASRSLTAVPAPLVKLKFISSIIPETTAKENKLSLALNGFTFNFYPDLGWLTDLIQFAKSPPGTFESVVPTERTLISLKITDGSVRALAPTHTGAIVLAIGGLNFVTDIIGQFPDTSFRLDVSAMSVLAIENITDGPSKPHKKVETGVNYWRLLGYALLAELSSTKLKYQESRLGSPEKQVIIDGLILKVHACADTFAAVGAFISDLSSFVRPPEPNPDDSPVQPDRAPAVLSRAKAEGTNLTASIDDAAFRIVPEVGPAPDMIYDDLPTNLDYLDESFGAAAGLRELTDDDLDEFDDQYIEDRSVPITNQLTGVISSVGGETIKVFQDDGINIIENYYDTLPRETVEDRPNLSNEVIRIRIHNSDVYLLLYDGYDWPRTRKIIEDGVKEMRKRLAKIRQLVANGQVQEPVVEGTNTMLFNSVYIGLDQDVEGAEPDALIAAIDEELREDFETGTQSSWQSLKTPTSNQPRAPSTRVHGKRLTRSKGPSMEFCLLGVNAEFNNYGGDNLLVSRTFVTVKDLEILDHIKTSTWKKFLTALRADSKGNIRETGANMVRVELHNVRPALGNTSEEARMRAKILPIRLYVDQDAVDFLKKFFSFKDPEAAAPDEDSGSGDAYIQMAEIFPIDLKLDYKPRRVDYRALKEGKTIELMNFFHFDGAEMTLRHIRLSGVTGWPKMFEMLNDLWTPDVKATQLMDVISGVAPIRSMVNVGSGVADLVLLPISQYKKDGRIVRGVQKGTTAFVKSTAIEAIKLGARLATGTQVILEQTEGLLGGDFDRTITAETIPVTFDEDYEISQDEEVELLSKYAQQPADIKEGFQSAYKSLQRNLSSAAQTILAVPMEVYERSGNEGPVRSVIRAVPIAVLRPMIGASEAVSKTLLGLHNTLDPNVRLENEEKYK